MSINEVDNIINSVSNDNVSTETNQTNKKVFEIIKPKKIKYEQIFN